MLNVFAEMCKHFLAVFDLCFVLEYLFERGNVRAFTRRFLTFRTLEKRDLYDRKVQAFLSGNSDQCTYK